MHPPTAGGSLISMGKIMISIGSMDKIMISINSQVQFMISMVSIDKIRDPPAVGGAYGLG